MARLDGGSTAQLIETDYLTIEDNIMKWSDTIIQISNISMVSTANLGSRPFPYLSILLILIGLATTQLSELFGFILLAGAAGWILYWYFQTEKEKGMKLFKISLNSGITFTIVFHDKKFLDEVFIKIAELMSKPFSPKNLTVNIKNNTFSGNASAVGTMNS